MATDDSMELGPEIIPFSKVKQQALLGYLLTDNKFFQTCRPRIKEEWWSETQLGRIWGIALELANSLNRPVNGKEVSDCNKVAALSVKETTAIQETIRLCQERRLDIGLDMLQNELTDWMRTRVYITAVKKSASIFNNACKRGDTKQLSEAYSILSKMAREIDDTTFEVGTIADMSDPAGDFLSQEINAKHAITTGLPALDRILLPEGEGRGSLLRGDMTVLLAPTNVGKTTAMITIAAANIYAGKDVLYVTHEGRESDLKLKIWQCLLGLSRPDVMRNLTNPDFAMELAHLKKMVKDHLVFAPMAKAGQTIEDVGSFVARRQEIWTAHHGHGFDLMVDDYAAKLSTQLARGGQLQLRQIQEIVYNYCTQMALEHNFHLLTAIQTNREGSKINNRQSSRAENRLIFLEDVAEAWGPMTTATNVISLNRDPVAQARNYVIYMVCKSRSSEVGWAVAAKSDFAAARSHWMDSPSTWYRGSGSSMSEKLESFLEGYQGREVPIAEVLKAENAAG